MNTPKDKLPKKEALIRLQELCSRSEKSAHELLQKLSQWGLDDSSGEILKQLQEEGFWDPLRFARAFAHDKITFNKWGKVKVRYHLRGHRIPEEIILQVFEEFDEEAYQDMIKEELRKKQHALKEKNFYKMKAKLFAFGNQRGYESHLISGFFNDEES
jgi:regulatory protein